MYSFDGFKVWPQIFFFLMWKKEKVAQSYPTLCNPMDYSLQGSSDHGLLQARILEWVAIPFFRGSSQSRDWTQVSCTEGRFFIILYSVHSGYDNKIPQTG